MTSWTDDRTDRLTTLWLEGHSASGVARQLGGVTRNAVIGKVHRLGLSGRAQPSAPARPTPQTAQAPIQPRRSVAVRFGRAAPAASPPKPLAATEPIGPPVPLLGLSACGCRFGLGDPRDDSFGFCGAPRRRGPYCEPHAEVVYQPRTARQAKADHRLLEQIRRTG